MAADKPRLILIDDDPLITDTLHYVLGEDFEVSVADSRPQARSLLRQLDAPPQLALVDLGLPPSPHSPEEGFRMIGELLAHDPDMKIFVLSGQNNDHNARHALSLGAMEFIPKPCEVDDLRRRLHEALKLHDAEITAESAVEGCGLIGESLAMQTLRHQIQQFADAPFPVLIEGESGSGKELVAECLHKLSARRGKNYLSLNCAAIAPTLAESILFGHAKGAFTGAHAANNGYFEDAAEGSLFLDEIGELPSEMQAKLLRVLENGEYQRVGETQVRKSRARILAATNRNLREEVRAGRFRGDLYHRLNVFSVQVPPLREMDDDRTRLLEHFRDFYVGQMGRPPFVLDNDAQKAWEQYAFPGNVRELRNVVIRLAAKFPGATVNRGQLLAEFDLDVQEATPANSTLLENPEAMRKLAEKHLLSAKSVTVDQVLRTWEKAYVEAALQLTQGNLTQAAKMLGVNRTTLYSRMQYFENSES